MGWDKQRVYRDSNHVDAEKPIKKRYGNSMRGEQEIASSPAVSLAFELRGNVAGTVQYAH
jgi:hypothetical protein